MYNVCASKKATEYICKLTFSKPNGPQTSIQVEFSKNNTIDLISKLIASKIKQDI